MFCNWVISLNNNIISIYFAYRYEKLMSLLSLYEKKSGKRRLNYTNVRSRYMRIQKKTQNYNMLLGNQKYN